jgi:hypothetical protein
MAANMKIIIGSRQCGHARSWRGKTGQSGGEVDGEPPPDCRRMLAQLGNDAEA